MNKATDAWDTLSDMLSNYQELYTEARKHLSVLESSATPVAGADWVQKKSKTQRKRDSKDAGEINPEATDLQSLNGLLKIVDELRNIILKFKDVLMAQEHRIDAIQQRQLKGNLILTSKPNKDSFSLIKSESELSNAKLNVLDHAISLIESKYKVAVKHNEIQACHFLDKHTIILRYWDRKPTSSFWKLCEGIKTGGDRNINFYINFQLTKHRSELSFFLRQLKREAKIAAYYTDENGNISLAVKKGGQKIRVTQTKEEHANLCKDDILKLISKSDERNATTGKNADHL